jgi:hypothetical protein
MEAAIDLGEGVMIAPGGAGWSGGGSPYDGPRCFYLSMPAGSKASFSYSFKPAEPGAAIGGFSDWIQRSAITLDVESGTGNSGELEKLSLDVFGIEPAQGSFKHYFNSEEDAWIVSHVFGLGWDVEEPSWPAPAPDPSSADDPRDS